MFPFMSEYCKRSLSSTFHSKKFICLINLFRARIWLHPPYPFMPEYCGRKDGRLHRNHIFKVYRSVQLKLYAFLSCRWKWVSSFTLRPFCFAESDVSNGQEVPSMQTLRMRAFCVFMYLLIYCVHSYLLGTTFQSTHDCPHINPFFIK
jgi:hypothetical protein